MILTRVLSETGGLLYHFKALRHRDSLWKPYRERLAGWLSQLAGSARGDFDLLLVGTSGGHCLSLDALMGFRSYRGLEPDPLGRLLFQRRHAELGLRFIGTSGAVALDRLDLEGFLKVVRESKNPFLLFSNVLGQLPLTQSDADRAAWTRELSKFLAGIAREGIPVASFHDLYSGKVSYRLPQPAVRGPYSESEVLSFAHENAGGEILDHGTRELFPGTRARALFSWELFPGVFHLIEGVSG